MNCTVTGVACVAFTRQHARAISLAMLSGMPWGPKWPNMDSVRACTRPVMKRGCCHPDFGHGTSARQSAHPKTLACGRPVVKLAGLLVSWSRYAAHCARGYPTTGGRVASASERIETSLWSGTTDQRTEVSIRGSLREQLLDHRTGADMGLVKYRGSGYPYQCQFGVGSGWLDAAAEFAGNSGKSDAAGQRSASSRGPKLAVGTFLLS
jgi:hypothetical protein